MVIWRFDRLFDETYAIAGTRGTWTSAEGTCRECGVSGQKRIQPLVIEWEEGSDVVGDFTVTGVWSTDIVLTERVADALLDD